jgi:hypothetical protein
VTKRVTTVCAAPLIAFLCVAALAQDPPRRIGSIDFYGYAGLNLEQIRSALPLHVGDQFPGPFETLEAVNKAVSSVIGRPPAGVSPVCCDAQGNYMIYIGLPGTSIKHIEFNPVPRGNTHFPPEIVELYKQTMDAGSASVLKGNAREDRLRYGLDREPSRTFLTYGSHLEVASYAYQMPKQMLRTAATVWIPWWT